MKYLIKNLRSFFCNSNMVAALSIISVLVSAVIINFSYGIYQNYNVAVENETYKPGSETMWLVFMNEGEDGRYASKGDVMDCIYYIEAHSDKLNGELVLFSIDGYMGEMPLHFSFAVKDGKLAVPTVLVNNLRKNGLLRENYWGDTDEQLGNPVALCFDYIKYDNDTPILDSIMIDEDTLVIDGKEYEIIGYMTWGNDDGATVPINSVRDSILVEEVHIVFDRGMSTKTYNYIKGVFEERFGDMVCAMEEELVDIDSIYTYKTVMVIALMIALVAGFNFMILYRYVLMQRRKKTAVYRICGMTRLKVNMINLAECMLITVPMYLSGMFLYDRMLLPVLSRYFPYMQDAYSKKLYLYLFAIYILVSLVLCGGMIFVNGRKRIADLIRS